MIDAERANQIQKLITEGRDPEPVNDEERQFAAQLKKEIDAHKGTISFVNELPRVEVFEETLRKKKTRDAAKLAEGSKKEKPRTDAVFRRDLKRMEKNNREFFGGIEGSKKVKPVRRGK